MKTKPKSNVDRADSKKLPFNPIKGFLASTEIATIGIEHSLL